MHKQQAYADYMPQILQYSNTASVTSNSTVEINPLFRADSSLTFVPGLGTNGQGILVSIGGGNENQLIDNSILDVYDLGAQGWVKQATQGRCDIKPLPSYVLG